MSPALKMHQEGKKEEMGEKCRKCKWIKSQMRDLVFAVVVKNLSVYFFVLHEDRVIQIFIYLHLMYFFTI